MGVKDDLAVAALARALVRTGMYVDVGIDTSAGLDNPRTYAAAILNDPDLAADGLRFAATPAAPEALREAAEAVLNARGVLSSARARDRLRGVLDDARATSSGGGPAQSGRTGVTAGETPPDTSPASAASAAPEALREAATEFLDWYDSPGRSFRSDGRGQRAIAAMRAALAAATPAAAPEYDTLEYDGDARQLIVTERLGPNEWGASQIVARDVHPTFGVWAEATWMGPAAAPDIDVERLADAMYAAGIQAHDVETREFIGEAVAATRIARAYREARE